MIDRTQLGRRIREARQQKHLSQQQLATAIGVSDKTISAYEVGRVDPPLDTLEKLSNATAHPIAYFIGDVQSNIEARLDRIANELTEIRKELKANATAPKPDPAVPQAIPSAPPPVTLPAAVTQSLPSPTQQQIVPESTAVLPTS